MNKEEKVKKEVVEKRRNFEESEVWDLKRVIIVIALIIAGVYIFNNNLVPKLNEAKTKVLGVSQKIDEKNDPKFQKTQEELDKLLNNAKQTISQVNLDNIASSAAELERIVNDIKALQNNSKEPLDVFCERVCKK